MPMYQCVDTGKPGEDRYRAVYRIQDGTERESHATREAAVECLISAAKIMNGTTIKESDIKFGAVVREEIPQIEWETKDEAKHRGFWEHASRVSAEVSIWPRWKRKSPSGSKIADRDILTATRRAVRELSSRLAERYDEVPFAQLACVIEDLDVISNKILFAYLPSMDKENPPPSPAPDEDRTA